MTPVPIHVLLERMNSQLVAAKELAMAQKLFIGGLAFSTSTERLREVFEAAGKVESAAVVTDRETGRSRGFGFIEMATAEEADQAIAQFNGKDVDGRQLRVEKASPGGSRDGGGRGFGASSRGGRW
jgi:RNA recognition motif-containing protein